jgi:hypothetical protein
MKTKAFRPKMMLNKQTIANLDKSEMRQNRAGNGTPRGTKDGWCAEITRGAFCMTKGNVCVPASEYCAAEDCSLNCPTQVVCSDYSECVCGP